MAVAGSTPERRNRSSIRTTEIDSRAAVSPLPMPSDKRTHSTPCSVLKYVPRSPDTGSPSFFTAATPTDTARGSASSSTSRSFRPLSPAGRHILFPSVSEIRSM